MEGNRLLPGLLRCSLAVPLLAGALAAVLYLPTVTFDLVLDSEVMLRRNDFLQDSATGLLDPWRHEYWHGCGIGPGRGNYRPLTVTTYLLTLRAGLDFPAVHHALNVLAHAVGTGLITRLLLRVGLALPIAAATGLAFAVHPVHVESVADVVGRAELLMALFAALALLAHLRAAEAAAWGRRGPWLAAALTLGFLAMASKENGVAVVGLVPVVEGLAAACGHPARWSGRDRWLAWGLWLVPLALYLGIRHAALGIWFQSGGAHVVSPLSALPLGERLPLALAVLAQVWRVSLPVARLSADYYFDQLTVPEGFTDLGVLLGLLGLALLAGLPLLLPARPGDRTALIALLGLAWFAVTWLPTSHVVFVPGELFAERWLHLPIAGLLLWAAALLRRLAGGGPLWRVLVGGLIAVMIASAAWHLPAWHDGRRLALATVRAAPRSWRALFNAGTEELFAGNYRAAIALFDEYFAAADRGDPRWPAAELNRQAAVAALEEFTRTGRRPQLPPTVPFERIDWERRGQR